MRFVAKDIHFIYLNNISMQNVGNTNIKELADSEIIDAVGDYHYTFIL